MLNLNNNIAIKVENISKIYQLYNNSQERLKEALHPFRKSYHKDFYALNDINLEIKKGETVGILGKNGAGKSTLLKIITGVLTPTKGKVTINGKVASLLELGAGFNPEMSGYENVYLNGAIMGFSKEEINGKIDHILEFADIGEFIYQPVKSYSSGMFARLAFATAINVDPDILIVDEALSVGDIKFQQKCIRRMENFTKQNKTILFVTHDTGSINKFCKNALWLDEGKIKEYGESKRITEQYFSYMSYGLEVKNIKSNIKSNTEKKLCSENIQWHNIENNESFGEGGAQIQALALYDNEKNLFTTNIKGNSSISLYLKIHIFEDIFNPIVGFLIKNSRGESILGYNTSIDDNILLKGYSKNNLITIKFSFKFPNLEDNIYFVYPAIADGTMQNHIQHHWVNEALEINVISYSKKNRMGWLYILDDIKTEEVII